MAPGPDTQPAADVALVTERPSTIAAVTKPGELADGCPHSRQRYIVRENRFICQQCGEEHRGRSLKVDLVISGFEAEAPG